MRKALENVENCVVVRNIKHSLKVTDERELTENTISGLRESGVKIFWKFWLDIECLVENSRVVGRIIAENIETLEPGLKLWGT